MPKVATLLQLWIAAIALWGVVALTPNMAWADPDDQDRAREAMLAGTVRPLAELMVHVEKMYEGTVIEVELEDDERGTGLLYEIKLLTPQGNLVKLEFDALSLELLTVDGHDSERARKADDKKDD